MRLFALIIWMLIGYLIGGLIGVVTAVVMYFLIVPAVIACLEHFIEVSQRN